MLTVSETASEAIRQLVEASPVPASAGVRIAAAGEPTEQGLPLALALVEAPEPGDAVVEQSEASVFIEAQVADFLDDTTLDAEVSDGEVSFALLAGEAPGPSSRNGSTPG